MEFGEKDEKKRFEELEKRLSALENWMRMNKKERKEKLERERKEKKAKDKDWKKMCDRIKELEEKIKKMRKKEKRKVRMKQRKREKNEERKQKMMEDMLLKNERKEEEEERKKNETALYIRKGKLWQHIGMKAWIEERIGKKNYSVEKTAEDVRKLTFEEKEDRDELWEWRMIARKEEHYSLDEWLSRRERERRDIDW